METSQALPLEAYIRMPTPRSNSPCISRAPTPPLNATTETDPGSG